MFSEIMYAFTEVAEMKKKKSEKRASFSIKCSRGDQSSTNKKLENTKKKNYFRR